MNSTMNEYKLQSYFKSLCNSFTIAYYQIKRLEKEEDTLETTYSTYEELRIVENLLQILELSKDLSNAEQIREQYVPQICSEEELKKKKEKLEETKAWYQEQEKQLKYEMRFWSMEMERLKDRIREILIRMKAQQFSIIITSQKEIITLMGIYQNSLLSEYRVINTQEKYLSTFPTGEMCEAFFRAYELEDEEGMKDVVQKYF